MTVHLPVSRFEGQRLPHRPTAVMGALMLTLLLEALDQTVVGTAMPRIIATLHGFDRYTWTVTSYVLASTIMLPIAGKLSDQLGRKRFLLAGTAIFLVGSALCGAAQTIDQLIVFRALQGWGAGIGISLVFAAVSDIFPGEEDAGDRARWQGILGSVYGISSVVGPTLGGWLSEHGPLLPLLVTEITRWRWVFYVNLPLGMVAVGVLLLYFPGTPARTGEREDDMATHQTNRDRGAVREGRGRQKPGATLRSGVSRVQGTGRRRTGGLQGEHRIDGIDIAGSALMAAATVSLLIGLTLAGEGSDMWGTRQVQVALGLATLLWAALIVVERQAREPVLSTDLFRNRVFAANAGLTFFLWMALFGMAFYLPLFLQGVLRVSSTAAGLVMTPFSLSIVAGNTLAGGMIARLRRYQAVAVMGTISMTGGVALLAEMSSTVSLTSVALFAVIAGLGMGILFTATSVVVQTVLPSIQLGEGFGVVRYLGQIGGVLGLALVGTVVNIALAAELRRRVAGEVMKQLAAEGVRLAASPQVLISPTFRHDATRLVLRRATAHISPGPGHATRVAAAVGKESALLNQVFEALRFSLRVAIQHGFLVVLLFCGGAVTAALLLRDRQGSEESSVRRH